MTRLTFNDYLAIGRIYSGKTKSEVLVRAARYQQEEQTSSRLYGLLLYLQQDLVVPEQYAMEILQLGRKLQPLEVEALHLRDKVQEAGVTGISITIDGLVEPKPGLTIP